MTVKIGNRKYKLETLNITPPGAGPFPLAVVSHGTPTRGGKKALRKFRIRDVYAIAEDFARRGYKAVVFARRGYASSKGQFREGYGRCSDATKASYVRVARNGAKDYAAIIEALAREADVDGSTVIAAGHSGGGFVVSALASKPPVGLVGIINFAGGRGGQKDGGNCSESGFVGAFGEFGKGQRAARKLVDERIERDLSEGNTCGFESTYSGRSRPDIVRTAKRLGYTTRAVFLGTETAAINIRRVRKRVEEGDTTSKRTK